MYLSHTRPDLTYALSVVSQFMHNPKERHMEAVMRILRYLKSNTGKGILFSKHEDYNNIKVYINADWADQLVIDALPQATVPLWEATLSHGEARNNMSLPVRALKQNIEAWPLGYVKGYG